MKAHQAKIFGIGLNKTGTTTLGACGKVLGLKCTGSDRRLLEDWVLRDDFSRIDQKVAKYDLFQDWPWPLVYKALDESYPGSKFILTVRKSDEVWYESLKRHSLRTSPTRHCRELAYGYNYPHKYKQEHLDFYNRHNQDVREYFKGRSSDLLEVCWEKGDGFKELCAFLGLEDPGVPIPHSNKSADVKIQWRRLWSNRLRALMS